MLRCVLRNKADHIPHDISSPTLTVAATEGALSEADTEPYQGHKEEAEILGDEDFDIPVPAHQIHPFIQAVGQVGGWAHLLQKIQQQILDGIHTYPHFWLTVRQQFPGETHIFGERVQEWESLHRICRQAERAAQELAAEEDPQALQEWETYIENTQKHH